MSKIVCPECGGKLIYKEEVSGAFTYSINEDGTVNYQDKEFYGDSWIDIECEDCYKSIGDAEFDGDNVYFTNEDK